EEVPGDPAGAYVDPLITRATTPLGVLVEGREEVRPLLILEGEMGKQRAAGAEDLVLELYAHWPANVGRFHRLPRFVADSHASKAHDLTAGCVLSLPLTPGGRAH